jgi:hypothetical protein
MNEWRHLDQIARWLLTVEVLLASVVGASLLALTGFYWGIRIFRKK